MALPLEAPKSKASTRCFIVGFLHNNIGLVTILYHIPNKKESIGNKKLPKGLFENPPAEIRFIVSPLFPTAAENRDRIAALLRFALPQNSRSDCTYRSAVSGSCGRSAIVPVLFCEWPFAQVEEDQCTPVWNAASRSQQSQKEGSVCRIEALPYYLMGLREIRATEQAGSSMVISLPQAETLQPSNFLMTTFSGSSKVLKAPISPPT